MYPENISEKIDIQSYIDAVKKEKISWEYFICQIEKLSSNNSNIDFLKHVNAILLNELKLSIQREKFISEINLGKSNEQVSNTGLLTNMSNNKYNHFEMVLIKEESESLEANIASSKENHFGEITEKIEVDKIWQCHICTKVYTSSPHLNYHVRNVHADENFHQSLDQEEEEDEINSKKNFRRHQQKQQSSNTTIPIENLIFHDEPPPSYNEVYSNKGHSSEKTRKAEAYNNKIWKCQLCTKVFNSAPHLNLHIRNVHEKKKNHEVVSIQEGFDKDKISALNHKDYKCTSCGKAFSQKRSLNGHILTVHEGGQDHKCDKCDKSFSLLGKFHASRIYYNFILNTSYFCTESNISPVCNFTKFL